LTAKIIGIKVYKEKGSKGENLTQAELVAGEGIAGDRHNDVTLLTKDALLFAEQNPGGLCFGRFKENILIDTDLQGISRITLGTAILETTARKKFCFTDCSHFSEENKCPFSKGVAFAQVVQNGVIIIHE
jgi:MOSC domain-containing protein YiiM